MTKQQTRRNRPDFTDPLAQTVLNSLSAHIAILDHQGVIVETNRAWRKFAGRGEMTGDVSSVGVNYLKLCDATTGPEADDAAVVAQGIRSVIAGKEEEFLYDYPCHAPDGKHWYYLRTIRMNGVEPVHVVVSHEEITALKLTEEALRRNENELMEQKQSLEEANIALKVLLTQRENDKVELEQKVLSNVRELVFPYVEKLMNARLKPRERTLVEITHAHLNDVISPLLQRLKSAQMILTPQEIQVAALVKEGRSSKEIADILTVSVTTVNFHRKNLRKKFGLSNTRQNLRAYLMSLS
ncbi:diguanylate cyclase/phosphodiesterase (GGDEF & EAL domains) with PAS/PAC sensor(s) [Olavius algarvensis associated proteobacterium Delta 3]|nr:diguanylate cyclase/phosphodiesterase (GGDEF & EAL domains) with PAS/PAC sensor(s) [Olavius algarvensis associated proteobacterium Delta 3]CAB5103768.1 diguanylate cyclase/phosphodiesterase (GGDEF & EAL domains) with PAS/PAC sensor(s) [Olavius algarvensis associated proteobacterium Delta 3]